MGQSMMELMFHIKVSAFKLSPRLYSVVRTRWPSLNYIPRTRAQNSSFHKTCSNSGKVNLIFQRIIQRSELRERHRFPFNLFSLESGYLDNSQQLAFSRRSSHPDSAQKYCRRRPSDKVSRKHKRDVQLRNNSPDRRP